MIVQSDFNPRPWLRNPHVQTLWPYLVRHRSAFAARRERLELPDGDFVDLDWNVCNHGPIVVVLHGLSGSIRSHYAKGILSAMQHRGIRAVLMNFRGASGEPNRLPRGYHAGDTGDLSTVMATLRAREPRTPVAAVGFSLGGNVLLKWLGEQRAQAGVFAAAAVSVPFDLARTTDRLTRGFSRLYQWHILKCLKQDLAIKARRVPMPVDIAGLTRISTFRQFDDLITAPLHGFDDAAAYYDYAGAGRYLSTIAVPTLILHALDDPFIPASALPSEHRLSATTTLEIAPHGGHVGFVEELAGVAAHWLENRLVSFLSAGLSARMTPDDCVVPWGKAANETTRP
jgi:predicted alpha/beta-fold hydrolase